MRILQVARYGSIRGGTETYVAALCEGLRASGHTVALAYGIDPDPSRPEVSDGFHVPVISEPGGQPGDAPGLRVALESFQPDLVHVHVPDVRWVAPYAADVAPTLLAVHDHRLHCPVGTKYWTAWERECRVKPGPWCLGFNLVAHCGSLRANVTLGPYIDWVGARTAARPLRLQVFSEYVRGELVRAGFDPDRVGMTHYPAPPITAPTELEPEGVDLPIVLASGRLNKEKGFAQLLEALAFCDEPVHLVVAGDGHEAEALWTRARRVPGVHRVSFTGWLDAGTLAAWTERAAIAVLPSMWPEPFGIAGLEAMTRARPVIAFASGGIPEWLADGESGVLVRPGDVEALGRAIERLVRDAGARARMGAAGKRRAETEFAMSVHLERLQTLYEETRAGALA